MRSLRSKSFSMRNDIEFDEHEDCKKGHCFFGSLYFSFSINLYFIAVSCSSHLWIVVFCSLNLIISNFDVTCIVCLLCSISILQSYHISFQCHVHCIFGQDQTAERLEPISGQVTVHQLHHQHHHQLTKDRIDWKLHPVKTQSISFSINIAIS